MAAATYASVYKNNYFSSTEDPIFATNNSQKLGEAWTYESNYQATKCTSNATNFKTGSATDSTSGCFSSTYKKRWFSLDTSGVKTYNTAIDTYNSRVSTYNAAANKFNSFVAKLKEEGTTRDEAYEAVFGKPASNDRENRDGRNRDGMAIKPIKPESAPTYTGFSHWTAAKQKNWLDGKGGDNAPGENEYVAGNNKLGGWGAWTISRIAGNYEDAKTAFISHSFGMLGTTQSTKLDISRSYVKNWQKLAGKNTSGVPTNIGSSTAEDFRATSAAGILCQAISSSATNTCVFEGASSAANTKYVYLNISVWSNA